MVLILMASTSVYFCLIGEIIGKHANCPLMAHVPVLCIRIVGTIRGAGGGWAASTQTLNTDLPQCPAWINNSCGHGPRDSSIPLIIWVLLQSKDTLYFTRVKTLLRACVAFRGSHVCVLMSGIKVVTRLSSSTHSAAHSWGWVCRRASCFWNLSSCLKSPLLNQSSSMLLQIRVVIPHGRFNRRERAQQAGSEGS